MKRLGTEMKIKIIEFAKKGLSLNKMSKITGKSKSTLYYHVKTLVRKVSKINLDSLTDWERGYLVGFFFGDGNLAFPKGEYSYRVVFNFNKNTEKEIANRITTLLKKTGGNPFEVSFKNFRNKSLLRVVCISKTLFNYLKEYTVYKKKTKGKNIISRKSYLKNFEHWSTEFKFGFIAGMIDSDGYIGLDKGSIRVLITSSSKKLSDQIYFMLNSLKIVSFLQYSKFNNNWTIRISTPQFNIYRNKINCLKGRWSNGMTLPSHH